MRKDLDTGIIMTDANGNDTVYANIAEAMEMTGLTRRQLEIRATREIAHKGVSYRWASKSTRSSYLGRKSRRKGNNWEREVIRRLRDIGYDCVSSRAESKRLDDAKVDIVSLDGKLPCHIQAKCTRNLPNHARIERECPLKDKPFVIACKQPGKPAIAMLPIDFFYELIKLRNHGQNGAVL